MLVGALQSGKIHAQYGRSLLIDWGFWSREPGFKYHLALSLAVAPRHHSALRRATVLIRRDEFEKWLQTALPDSPTKRAAASMADRCETWLKALIRDSGGVKPASKPSIRRDAMRDLPGLSARLFDIVWLRVAPPHWQKKGAPRRRN